MFKHNGVQNILNEQKHLWNKFKPSIFFDEAKYGPLLFASHNQDIQNALVIAHLFTSGQHFLIS